MRRDGGRSRRGERLKLVLIPSSETLLSGSLGFSSAMVRYVEAMRCWTDAIGGC